MTVEAKLPKSSFGLPWTHQIRLETDLPPDPNTGMKCVSLNMKVSRRRLYAFPGRRSHKENGAQKGLDKETSNRRDQSQ